MSWAILEVAKSRHIQEKLQSEIDRSIGEIGGFDKLEFKYLFKFEYLTRVLNEALRWGSFLPSFSFWYFLIFLAQTLARCLRRHHPNP